MLQKLTETRNVRLTPEIRLPESHNSLNFIHAGLLKKKNFYLI